LLSEEGLIVGLRNTAIQGAEFLGQSLSFLLISHGGFDDRMLLFETSRMLTQPAFAST
jgi:hypothetical protein